MTKFIVLLTSVFILLFVNIFSFVPKTQKDTSLKNKISQQYDESLGCNPTNIQGSVVSGEGLATFEGNEITIPQLAFIQEQPTVLGAVSDEKWIEVDLSDQKLTAWQGNSIYLETSISSGLPWTPTPTGEFRIWIKLRSTKMEGGQGKYYYYLPNVPYVMYFSNASVPSWKGYGIHGTYWHSDFGTPRSHGCVNVPTDIAGRLYTWVTPDLKESAWGIKSSDQNPGTKILIHE